MKELTRGEDYEKSRDKKTVITEGGHSLCPTCASLLKVQGHTTKAFIPLNAEELDAKSKTNEDFLIDVLTDMILAKEKVKALEKKTREMGDLIDLYQLEIRNAKKTIGVDLEAKGFCGGMLFGRNYEG